jgi:hypothetical protein
MRNLDLDSARVVFSKSSRELRGLLTLLVVVGDDKPVASFESLKWFNIAELGHPSETQGITQWTLLDHFAKGQRFQYWDLPNWAVGVLWRWFRGIPRFEELPDDDLVFPSGTLDKLRAELGEVCRLACVDGAEFEQWQALGSSERLRAAGARQCFATLPLHRANRDEFFLSSLAYHN